MFKTYYNMLKKDKLFPASLGIFIIYVLVYQTHKSSEV